MAWIKVDQTLIDHRKVVDAAEALNRDEVTVVGHLIYLWCWALDSAPDGGPLTARQVVKAAHWTRAPEPFVRALVDASLLDERDGNYYLHDWDDYAGQLVQKRKQTRERVRKSRSRNAHVTRTIALQDANSNADVTPLEQSRVEEEEEKIGSAGALPSRARAEAPALYGLLVGMGIQRPPDQWVERWLLSVHASDVRFAIERGQEARASSTRYLDKILDDIAADRAAGRTPKHEQKSMHPQMVKNGDAAKFDRVLLTDGDAALARLAAQRSAS